MPLSLDYRPNDFKSVYGNKATMASLEAIFGRESDYPHAILLQGPKGTGKTTTARIIARFLLGVGPEEDLKLHPDFTQMDGGEVNAKAVTDIKNNIRYKPLKAKNKVVVFEEAHMIGQGGGSEKNVPQNNLLTTLEEPPSYVYFILCTTNPERLLSTIRNRRCQTFEFSNLNMRESIDMLQDILKKENVDWVSEAVLKKIYEVTEGCPAIAVNMLDQVIDLPDEKLMLEAIVAMNFDENQINDLWNALLQKQSWSRVRLILKNMDLSEHEKLRRAMLTRMSNVMLDGEGNAAAMIFDCFKRPFYDSGKAGFINACFQAVVELS